RSAHQLAGRPLLRARDVARARGGAARGLGEGGDAGEGMGVSSGPSVAEAERLLAEGNALEDGGDPAAALSRYEAARAACPDFARVPLNLANALHKLGRV